MTPLVDDASVNRLEPARQESHSAALLARTAHLTRIYNLASAARATAIHFASASGNGAGITLISVSP